jgi:hypothetical protein
MTPTGDEPMLNAYDGEYDAGCGAGAVFCCGVDAHPATATIANASAIRFMNPFECKNGRQDFWEARIRLFVAKVFCHPEPPEPRRAKRTGGGRRRIPG